MASASAWYTSSAISSANSCDFYLGVQNKHEIPSPGVDMEVRACFVYAGCTNGRVMPLTLRDKGNNAAVCALLLSNRRPLWAGLA